MSDCPTVRVKPTHESQGEFVLINEAEFDAAVHELYVEPGAESAPKADGPTEIPDGWADLHHMKRIALAKAFNPEVASAAEADAAIEAEVAKRAAEAQA